jgi:hypothetical protein
MVGRDLSATPGITREHLDPDRLVLRSNGVEYDAPLTLNRI